MDQTKNQCMKTILLFLGIFLSVLHAHAAIIAGVVNNAITGEPISSVYLILENANKTTASDINGIFKFSDIQPGTYTLLIRTIGDKKEEYRFPIATEYDSIFIKINLGVPNGIKLVCNTEIEAYQNKLNEDFPNIGDALDIKISKVLNINDVDDEEGLFVDLEITNKARVPVYLFKDYFCLRRITPIVTDANNDTINFHYTLIDCEDQPMINYPADLFEIIPEESIKIKKQRLGFYYHNLFPPGDYRIKIIYEYQIPNYLIDSHENAKNSSLIADAYCKVIRGRFESNWLGWSKK